MKDQQGREFLAGSVPAAEGDLFLPPGRTGRVLQDTALRFSRNAGEPVSIASMTGFVSQVEFADGTAWVPNRLALQLSGLLRMVAASPEEQRLAKLSGILKSRTGKTHAISRLEPILDSEGEVKGYMAFAKP